MFTCNWNFTHLHIPVTNNGAFEWTAPTALFKLSVEPKKFALNANLLILRWYQDGLIPGCHSSFAKLRIWNSDFKLLSLANYFWWYLISCVPIGSAFSSWNTLQCCPMCPFNTVMYTYRHQLARWMTTWSAQCAHARGGDRHRPTTIIQPIFYPFGLKLALYAKMHRKCTDTNINLHISYQQFTDLWRLLIRVHG